MMTSAHESPSPPRPPVFVRAALRLFLHVEERAEVLSELRELWEGRVAREGAVTARRWYVRQLRGYPLRLLRYRARAVLARALGRRSGAPVVEAVHGASWLEGVRGDVAQSLRSWAKSPVLALTVILTVGLGLGASTAMLGIVRVVLLDPLPYGASDRMVRIYHALGENRWPLAVADYLAIEEQQTHFDGVAAYATSERTLATPDGAERVRTRAVTAGWFDLLQLSALRGRTFHANDGLPGTAATAVVSWGFWQRRLGGGPDAVGRTLRLNDQDYTVIGVLPRAVGPLEERVDVFPILQLTPPTRRGPFMLTIVGRLKSGAEMAAAGAELESIIKRNWPDATSTYGVMRLDEFVVGRFRTMLLVLLGAVVMVLLVASTNAASLLTARTMQRRTELATRAALGASRGRLARLLVTESVMLACGGALFGIALARLAVGAVHAAGPALLPRAEYVALDATVLGFAGLLTGLSLLVFGIIPALQLLGTGGGIAGTLRAGGRTMSGTASSHRVRRVLVASQFALAVPLLAGAALLLNTFLRLQRIDPGFDADGVVTMRIARSEARDSTPEMGVLFWNELLERVRVLPGVTGAGLNSDRPPRGAGNINNFDLLDKPVRPGEVEPMAVWLVASPGYFDALSIRLVAGRMFDARDTGELETTPALVDRTWAETMYPGEDPIGKRMYEGGCRAEDCRLVEVVGVVENVRYLGLDDAQAGVTVGTLYVPYSQWVPSLTNLFVRAQGDPLALVGSIRGIVRELDRTVPIAEIALGTELIDDALAAPRNLASVVLAFAAVAVLLAMIGIYGVMSYFVNEHRRDIGIRLVLGGRPAAVLGLVLGRGMQPVIAGTLVGFLIAAGVTRFLSRLLFGVSPRDPATLALVALAMLSTALAACWLPAHRAARLEPAQVLRQE
jgi:putative ABC transport system permease protein